MFGFTKRAVLVVLLVVGLVGLGATAVVAKAKLPAAGMIKIDVAEDFTKFVYSESPVDGEGLPAAGNYFVTEGYIYPDGTLSPDDEGVLPDGSPQFPDEVIGRWICYGTHIGDAGASTTGAWVATTQIFQFSDTPGEDTIVTDGVEIADVGVPVQRAITGGTGKWRSARGTQEQVFRGFGADFGVALDITLKVRK